MRKTAIALLLCGLVLAPVARANIEISDAAGSPLKFTNAAGIPAVLQITLGDMYDVLRNSSNVYRIVFRTDARIARALRASRDVVAAYGGYFEKDVNSDNRYFLFVNSDYVARTVQKQVQEAQAELANLTEPQRNEKILFLTRLIALGIIAHEATHALQFERSRVAFGPRLGDREMHDKIAHDRYDEQEGYENQSRGIYRLRNLLNEANTRRAHTESIQQANKDYSRIPAVYMIVRDGQEAQGEAPFPWPASDAKGMAGFISGLLQASGGGSAPGADQGVRAAASEGDSSAYEGSDESNGEDEGEITDVSSLEGDSGTEREAQALRGKPRDMSDFIGDADIDPTTITYSSPGEAMAMNDARAPRDTAEAKTAPGTKTPAGK